ncbi:hypothetical protein C8J57DRAFT_1314993 [Mycena rebaudengoi]|nr:hypothetical protein C8J57DRAFT_1314993 [Mycena rebaudengoi]
MSARPVEGDQPCLPTTSPSLPGFPDRNPCFGDSSNLSTACQVPTSTMIDFLNITNPNAYLNAYCLNPPEASCAFGYCPNPDVASPAVRYSTYFTTIVSAILVLYSPEDVMSSFFAQLLNVFSLVIAAIISIGQRNLTKPHTIIALALAGSPLSAYLIIYAPSHLRKGMWLNRFIVLSMVPLWISVLVFATLPEGAWHFQQAACDANRHVVRLFFIPFISFFEAYPELSAALFGMFAIAWGAGIYLQRGEIWKKHNKVIPWRRIWRKVVDAYPFIQFCTVILVPHTLWVLNIEIGIMTLLARESFSPTYGQLLAIFVTVPPFVQLLLVLPRLPLWFLDLTWVRYINRRQDEPLLSRPRRNASETTIPFHGDFAMSKGQYHSSHSPSPMSTFYESSRHSWEESVPLREMPTPMPVLHPLGSTLP